MNKQLTKSFWLLNGNLLFVNSGRFFYEVREKNGIEYALDICGEPVFGCVLSDDGDPGIETTGTPKADEELFNMFIKEIAQDETKEE